VTASNTHVGMRSACTGIQNFASRREMAISTYYVMEFKTYIMINSRDATVEAVKFWYIRMNIEKFKRHRTSSAICVVINKCHASRSRFEPKVYNFSNTVAVVLRVSSIVVCYWWREGNELTTATIMLPLIFSN